MAVPIEGVGDGRRSEPTFLGHTLGTPRWRTLLARRWPSLTDVKFYVGSVARDQDRYLLVPAARDGSGGCQNSRLRAGSMMIAIADRLRAAGARRLRGTARADQG